MGRSLVIKFPLLILYFTLLYGLFNLVQDERVLARFPWLKVITTTQVISTLPVNLKTSPENLYHRLNTYRLEHNLPTFNSDPQFCPAYAAQSADNDQESIFTLCPHCFKASVVKLSKFATVEIIFAQIIDQSSIASVLSNPDLTLLCIKEDPQYLTLLFAAQQETSSPKTTSPPIAIVTVPPKPPLDFTESELWSALTEYRRAHGVSTLEPSDHLCQYARKRVQEHINRFETDSPESYPVPDKYPLDGHAGFARDADSNYVFETTGFNHIAENLAYWPSAQSPVHIIEWGWDSSTEGHRETQLSKDFTHACLSGSQGFYVAIFASH